MTSPYDKNSLPGHHAEGNSSHVLDQQAKYNDLGGLPPAFCRYVILDVISDPSVIDDQKLDFWVHDLGVTNRKEAAVAPRNSIIARRVLGNGSTLSEKTMVLYPFFPPHMAFPAKPGEHVWAMFENVDAKVNDIGYWMCRIVGPNFIEDVNYTHADRALDASFTPGTKDSHEGNTAPKYEFPNGAAQEKDGQRYTSSDTASLEGNDKAYETLLNESEGSKNISYESVPRYRKRPGETAFEGTNNTLIVLGTDREGPVSDYVVDSQKGKVPVPHDGDQQGEGTGMAGFVVGRGQTSTTAGKTVTNSLGKHELGKSKAELTDKEGDVDLKNDRSSMVVFQRTKIDSRFGLDGFNGQFEIEDTPEGGVAIKSDKLRFIARSDIEIIVTDFERDDNGRMKSLEDPSGFAAIVIKRNGDIVFKPSQKGLIKLGGDDANLAVLCTAVNNQGADGTVTASPIIDTMAGSQGQGGPAGEFSKKVLLK